MSGGWTAYVSILVTANILGCVWLLWWTSRRRSDTPTETETTGHTWDGDLTEYNKPLPRWWLNLFYATIVFGVAYLVLYPGMGSWAGTRQWSSGAQLRHETASADALLETSFARFRAVPLDQLALQPEAAALGASLFAAHCAACHGSDARGAKGYPNLTDADWLWGGAPERVLQTVLDGRRATMPALGGALGEDGVAEAAVYVQSLGGGQVDPRLAQRGKARYALCAACHGAEGKGNPELGAPNLTDGIWLYGADFESLVTSIRDGRNGNMPAHRGLIGEDRARLVAAWVLGRGASGATASAGH